MVYGCHRTSTLVANDRKITGLLIIFISRNGSFICMCLHGFGGNANVFSGNADVFSGNADMFTGNADVFSGKTYMFSSNADVLSGVRWRI